MLWRICIEKDGYPTPKHIFKAAELVETQQRRKDAGACTVVSLYVFEF